MTDIHANYVGDLRYLLNEERDKAQALIKTWPQSSSNRVPEQGAYLAYCEVNALVDELGTDYDANYLFDLGLAVREAGERAKRDADRATWDVERSGDADRSFHEGRKMAYVYVLSLMQQQAGAFGIPLEDLGLDGLDPERDLL